jgi:hypothetical protein
MAQRHSYLHEAVASAVRRKYSSLQVISANPAGEVDGWKLEIKGGTNRRIGAAYRVVKWWPQ